MLKAHRTGRRICYSNEWSSAQRYYIKRNPEFEARFVNTVAWTATVLDYTDETLKEGITLNDDGTIAKADTVLGRKDKIVLPYSSAYVKDLPEDCMPLIAYLHGVTNPKRQLPDYALVSVITRGIRPLVRGSVVRGLWGLHDRNYWRVSSYAYYAPVDGRFAAWLVDEKLSENIVTPEEYAALERELSVREAELAAIRERYATLSVLVE